MRPFASSSDDGHAHVNRTRLVESLIIAIATAVLSSIAVHLVTVPALAEKVSALTQAVTELRTVSNQNSLDIARLQTESGKLTERRLQALEEQVFGTPRPLRRPSP